MDFDVLFIGSGHAAFDGAVPLGLNGQKVGVVEENLVGGTCPNYGCNAKITLEEPAEISHLLKQMAGRGLAAQTMNWHDTMIHKHEIIKKMPALIESVLASGQVKIIRGHARLQDAHTVIVDGQAYTAEKLVIATGARPHELAIVGAEYLHDSQDFMSLAEIPAHITILGGGYIGMEFATIALAAGAQVDVIVRHETILANFYQPFVTELVASLKAEGVRFIMDTDVEKVQAQGANYLISGAGDFALETYYVLNATGRVPNVENIGLDIVGVQYNAKGVVVDEFLQTSVAGIYAAGDVVDKQVPKLTPTAIFESHYLAKLLSGETTAPIKYPYVPTVTFTTPRIAMAGVTPDEAAAHPDVYEITENNVRDDWYRQVRNENFGQNILVFDKAHHLVGITEISDRADEVVNAVLPAMEFGWGPAEFERLPMLFPSITASAFGQI
ncbi:dihydrolipoyl dehydrogenase family protein [Periweissella cryptocerci]|nr:NAD(P)/FAD-dependent oxidoreductase [Periweissella cryptocerci]